MVSQLPSPKWIVTANSTTNPLAIGCSIIADQENYWGAKPCTGVLLRWGFQVASQGLTCDSTLSAFAVTYLKFDCPLVKNCKTLTLRECRQAEELK